MKKSIKRFLILSQVLGWSALVASACTDNQVKTISQTTNSPEDQKNKTQSENSTNESEVNTMNKDQHSEKNVSEGVRSESMKKDGALGESKGEGDHKDQALEKHEVAEDSNSMAEMKTEEPEHPKDMKKEGDQTVSGQSKNDNHEKDTKLSHDQTSEEIAKKEATAKQAEQEKLKEQQVQEQEQNQESMPESGGNKMPPKTVQGQQQPTEQEQGQNK